MVLHVIHARKDPRTSLPSPLTHNAGVMLRLVPITVLLTAEPSAGDLRVGLRTPVVPAEEVLPVSVVVLAQVAAAAEEGWRGAVWVCAAPGAWVAEGGCAVEG